MFFTLFCNNLLVALVYMSAGLIVKGLTNSSLARLAPWCVLTVHLLQNSTILLRELYWLGWLGCLAWTLPHGLFELPGLILACVAGTRLYRKKNALVYVACALVLILCGALVEAYVTPFPFAHWLEIQPAGLADGPTASRPEAGAVSSLTLYTIFPSKITF